MADTNNSSQQIINCIRFLAVDAIEKAKSGHPGMPMGMAPAAFTLWSNILKHNPENPAWPDRDRFILSAGHGSMLLYALLHISGYGLPLEELINFRQWGSRTPGHPEYGLTPGVETTTGPLGQGFGNAVGMAIAEQYLTARYNRPDFKIVDHFTFVIAGDGCLMEGVSQEAASLAGHLGLGKLIVIYDDNHITIDGSTELAFTEDVLDRFKAYGWDTSRVQDANDCRAIEDALNTAKRIVAKPSLIAIRSHIAFGSPNKQDTAGAHGSPLGTEEANLAKENLGWPLTPQFHIPEEVKEYRKLSIEKGEKTQLNWNALFQKYREKYPDLAESFINEIEGCLPDGWHRELPCFDKGMATRAASGKVINAVADKIGFLMGGSADLTPSNNTFIKSSDNFSSNDRSGRNIHFGVREHAMGAVLNGMALHKGIIPYGGTFLVFSDYMRPSIRLAALMEIPVVYVFTHDSIGLGEDGPTHQSVEHLAVLRAIPGLTVIRPADPNETVGAWKYAIENRKGPVALVLTRQAVPLIDLPYEDIINGVSRGAYIVAVEEGGDPEAIIVSTGSEVSAALAAKEILGSGGMNIRVVSLPSWEIFEGQADAYREQILPPDITKISVEAQVTQGWERWTGDSKLCIGLNRFGVSAPGHVLFEKFGFTAEAIADRVRQIIQGS